MPKTKSKPCPGSKIRSGGREEVLEEVKEKGLLVDQVLVEELRRVKI